MTAPRPSGCPPGPGAVRVGCSGWQYREWAGSFYPAGTAARDRFASYAQRFDTVELNTTFYRLPEEPVFRAWRAAAPPGFVYAAKLGSFGSHRKKLRDAAGWLRHHVERARLLGPAQGPTVVQLPPHWRRNVERLDEFLTVATAWPELRWAVELRDPTWVHDNTFCVLARHGAALVLHDLLQLPWQRTTGWTYLRFHGPDATAAPYRGRYPAAHLRRAAERLRPWIEDGTDVYAYFNNDIGGAAPIDAAALRRRLTS